MNAPVCQHEPSGTESCYRLEHVSDADLLAGARRLVGRQNQVLAELLAHLAEVEARGIQRLRACPSIYAYCVYELRLSEDAAFRRSRAARLARRFPVIFQQVADGELHLTAVVMLAPHLTEENHRQLLALAKHRTKREILRIVRTLAPEPSVPDRVELLSIEPVGIASPRPPTWRSFVNSLAAGVRELQPGDRPKDWVDRASAASESGQQQLGGRNADMVDEPAASAEHDSTEHDSTERCPAERCPAERCPAERCPAERCPAERYRVQFTASREYADLLERAQDLLSHAVPDRSLEAVHLQALRLLVEQLEKRKYGAPRTESSEKEATTPAPSGGAPPAALPVEPPVEPAAEATAPSPSARPSKKHAHTPRQRVPAAVRREVRDRDGVACAFVDESGQRCRETRFLELHHVHAHALGGEPVARNLKIFCQAHNALAAEQDFGREFVHARSRRRRR